MSDAALRILVAEDQPLLRRLLDAVLVERGHKVELVEDGLQALAELEQRSYDVLVTDFRMPVMTGADLIRALRGRPEPLGIVLMSANSLEETSLSAEELSGVVFLRKPFGLDELHRAIQESGSSR